jgi:hypothetical protein
LSPERLHKLQIWKISRPKQKEALHGQLSNREYPVSWTWEELRTISDKVELPHSVELQWYQEVSKGYVFSITKKIILMEKKILEERVWQGQLVAAWGPFRNVHNLVPQNNEKYCSINSAVSAIWHTVEDTGMQHNVEE